MPNFTVQIVCSDLHTIDWKDDGLVGQPQRLNAPLYPHRYMRLGRSGLPVSVTVNALVGGVLLADSGLGGHLFQWWWSQRGQGAPPSIMPAAGHSATITWSFLSSNLGTWVLDIYRDQGGAWRVPLSVETVDAP